MIEVTLLTSGTGPLSKHISLGEAGRVVSDGSRCRMSEGRAARAPLTGPEDLARLIGAMPADRAIALGRLRDDLPAEMPVVTHRRLQGGSAPAGAIARTRHHIAYAAGLPAFALLDFDRKGMPDSVARILAAEGGFWPALVRAIPAIAPAARVRRASTSAGLFDVRTGERMGSAVGGEHVYVLLGDGADVERFLRDIHERCWLHGLGWYTLGAAGQLLERSVVDRTVGAPERLVFEGPPTLVPPLRQDRAAREPGWAAGEALDTRAACPPLTAVEEARVKRRRRPPGLSWRPKPPGSGRRRTRCSPGASRSATACRRPPPCAWPRRATGAFCSRRSSSPSTTRRSARRRWPRCCATPSASSARR